MKQKTVTVQTGHSSDAAPVISAVEDNSVFTDLATTLAEIRKLKGVTGYILRSSNAAIIDVTQKEFTIQYAMLSSQVNESTLSVATQFNLTNVESVLVEGKAVKLLCMSIGDNKLSIFMEKACDHVWIVKRILL